MDAHEANQIGNLAISEFLDEWRRNPWAWLQEIDVQIDLTTKIKSKLREEDRIISAFHGHSPSPPKQFSRVTCEPYVLISPGRRAIHPDIVIWGDLQQGHRSCKFINDGYWPILWTCEIKYSFNDPASGEDDDRERLEELIKHSGTEGATQLVLIQAQKSSLARVEIATVPHLKIRREYLA